jgi:hypothetical protein
MRFTFVRQKQNGEWAGHVRERPECTAVSPTRSALEAQLRQELANNGVTGSYEVVDFLEQDPSRDRDVVSFLEASVRARAAGTSLETAACLRFLGAISRLTPGSWAEIDQARKSLGVMSSKAKEELRRLSSAEGSMAAQLASVRAADEQASAELAEAAGLAAQAVLYRGELSPSAFAELYRPFKTTVPDREINATSPAYFTRLSFRAGSAPGSPALDLEPGPVVLIVGPNNSGKSQCLREIEQWCMGGSEPSKVLAAMEFRLPTSFEDAIDLLEPFATIPQQGQQGAPLFLMASHHTPTTGGATRQIGTNQIRAAVIAPASVDRVSLLGSHTLRLDGRTRFNLCNPTQGGDLLVQPPQNHLWSLFANGSALRDVDAMVSSAFDRHEQKRPGGVPRHWSFTGQHRWSPSSAMGSKPSSVWFRRL